MLPGQIDVTTFGRSSDHSGLVKFTSSSDPDLLFVTNALYDLASKADMAICDKWRHWQNAHRLPAVEPDTGTVTDEAGLH